MSKVTHSVSLVDFQRNAPSILDGLNRNHEPLLLTMSGKVQGAVIDMPTFQAFEAYRDQERFLRAVEEGLRDLDAGRTEPLDEVKVELRARYGL